MSAGDRLRGLLAGVAAGIAGGLFGVGGGTVLVPMLTGLFGLTQHEAHGTSLAVIGATALAALAVYGAHANVAWSTAAFIALGSLVSAPFGARWASHVSARGLKRSFAVFLGLVALRLLWQAPAVGATQTLSTGARIAVDLLVGLATGTLAGFMGVGGGLIVVPACTLLFGMTQQAAQGTSLAVILVTAARGRDRALPTWERGLARGSHAGAGGGVGSTARLVGSPASAPRVAPPGLRRLPDRHGGEHVGAGGRETVGADHPGRHADPLTVRAPVSVGRMTGLDPPPRSNRIDPRRHLKLVPHPRV